MGGNGKFRHWRISFHRSSHAAAAKVNPPEEFLCPISKSLMSDPTIVSSGQTFERVCVNVCRDLGFAPTLSGGSIPDFSTVIPNMALKTAILNWCTKSGSDLPHPPLYSDIESTIRSLMSSPEKNQVSPKIRVSTSELQNEVVQKTPFLFSRAVTELSPRNLFSTSSSSDESVIANTTPLLPFATRPSCFSYSSSPSTSSEFIIPDEATSSSVSSGDDEGFISKMKSLDICEQEQAVILLRKTTKTNEEARSLLCSERLLYCLKNLLDSRYDAIQTNATAALVNLSLEKGNKVKIVRAGIVPLLIDILKNGFDESREHATGAIFSLALEDKNKTAIGVLGALQPLMHELRSGTRRSRLDAALALYHLTLVSSNRVKMVKLGAAGVLIGMMRDDVEMAARVVLVVCNLAACDEGRAALLDGNAVGCLVEVIGDETESGFESIRENCVAVLYLLSQGSLRFKGLAREVGAVQVLRIVAETGCERVREKARRILEVLRGPEEAGEVDWEAVMKGGVTRARYRLSQEVNSTEF
ncbi:hypothetical protein CASFOL_015629 [Castilleja foliolosa]|uniref:RING-type E3 ubiquitin transferase n=1 Tax=Castilleja foliolosa TaxID=1961234 RepID=A0ABD3DIA8_9LAMI